MILFSIIYWRVSLIVRYLSSKIGCLWWFISRSRTELSVCKHPLVQSRTLGSIQWDFKMTVAQLSFINEELNQKRFENPYKSTNCSTNYILVTWWPLVSKSASDCCQSDACNKMPSVRIQFCFYAGVKRGFLHQCVDSPSAHRSEGCTTWPRPSLQAAGSRWKWPPGAESTSERVTESQRTGYISENSSNSGSNVEGNWVRPPVRWWGPARWSTPRSWGSEAPPSQTAHPAKRTTVTAPARKKAPIMKLQHNPPHLVPLWAVKRFLLFQLL